MSRPSWQKLPFGECVTLLSGGTPSKSRNEYWGGNIPWVSSKDLKSERIYTTDDLLTPDGVANGTRLVPEGTVLFVVRSMILANRFPVSIAMRPVAFNQDLKAVVCRENVLPLFIYYWLRANEYEILGRVDEAAHGTKRIQTDRLVSMNVDLPPLDVQQHITSILSAYDDLIENCERRIRVLDAMARALYREWFVLFRYPGHERTPLVESASGRIPNGWAIRSVKDLAVVTYGFPFKSALFSTEPSDRTPVVRIRDIPAGASSTYTSEPAEQRYEIEDGDILVGMDGDFHMTVWSNGRAFQNQRVARFRASRDWSALQLFLALEGPIQALNASIVGTTVAHLGDMHIRDIHLPEPSAEVMARSRPVFEQFDLETRLLQKEIRNLRKTRDLLLPRLLSGQLSVEEAA